MCDFFETYVKADIRNPLRYLLIRGKIMQNYELPGLLPEICAPRENLLSVFEERTRNQFVYIHAPGGYGKTISTLLWLKKTGRNFAWFTLDSYDNTLSLFYRSLCRSLLAITPQAESVVHFLSSPSFSAAPVESTMEFLSMFIWCEEKTALVLDDLHNMTNRDILKSLPFVLKRLPLSVNVLFLSRISPHDAQWEMPGNGNAGFINGRELAFTAEEIRSHYASYGQFITRERAFEIYNYTDGWAIILNVMVTSGSLEPGYEDLKSSFGNFFEKNIWNRFDEATQTFLLKTAIVDSFTRELCERLTGDVNCTKTLNRLIKENINLIRLDEEYHYHNLFLEFLRQRLQTSEIEQKNLYGIAANYYLEANEFCKAAGYALSSGNGETGMMVIQNFFKSKTPTLDQHLELAQVYDIKTLSDEFCKAHPILYMPNILSAFLSGDMEQTKRFFDMFYEALPAFIKLKAPIADVAVTQLILDYRIGLSELPAFMDSCQLNCDKKVPGQAAVVTMNMPMLHRSNRDYTEFLDARTKESVRRILACLLPGDCERFYQSAAAGLLMEQNRLDEALETALAAYNGIDENTAGEIYFGISTGLAEIYVLKSEMEQYRSIISWLHQWIREKQAQYLLKNLMAYEERVKLWDGDQKAAEEWLDNYFVSDHVFGEFYRIYQNFTTARAYIVLSMTDKAMAALKQLQNLGGGMNRPLDMAEAAVLTAVTEWMLGQKKEARDRLHGVFTMLCPYGYVRVIANEGKAVLPIIAAVLKKLNKEAAKADQLYNFVKETQAAAHERARRFKGITGGRQLKVVKLSPKQTLIIELLAKGHKNAEIIEITGYSINTVRSYTRIAYEKLEVNNALDAVLKARQLGILK